MPVPKFAITLETGFCTRNKILSVGLSADRCIASARLRRLPRIISQMRKIEACVIRAMLSCTRFKISCAFRTHFSPVSAKKNSFDELFFSNSLSLSSSLEKEPIPIENTNDILNAPLYENRIRCRRSSSEASRCRAIDRIPF